jgi:SnoaL-like domain
MSTTSATELIVTPFDAVRAQLSRQKWAVDTRDAAALPDIYASNCELVLNAGGPQGTTEVSRVRGREQIIAFMVAGWARTADSWWPGSMIHHIGTQILEPTGDGGIRCRSYATYVHVLETGATEMHGYGKYDDIWTPEDETWRLASRNMCVYGMNLTTAPATGSQA